MIGLNVHAEQNVRTIVKDNRAQMEEAPRERADSSVRLLKNDGDKLPLFLIHGVDGGLERLEALARHLAAHRPIYGIRSQALLSGSVAHTSIEDLAAFYLRDVREIQPHGPYYLLGYSFGGLIAFEMGRAAHAMGEPIGMLGLLDNMRMAAPDATRGAPTRGLWKGVGSHVQRVVSRTGFSYAREKILHRSLRILYATLDAIHQPIPGLLRRPYDINWFAASRYTPPHFPGRVILFQASASARNERASDDLWARVAGGGVEIRQIDGNHEELIREPKVQLLARDLEKYLADLP
jgi:thioesterase domain-containing protein